MKYLLCLGMLLAFTANADITDLDTNRNGIYEAGEIDPKASYPAGPCECLCPTTRFREKKYCKKECVSEPYTVQKKGCRYVEKSYTRLCCRYVDQPYEVKCKRMVPEYYTKVCYRKVPEYYEETVTRLVPEYYTTDEVKYCDKWIQKVDTCYEPYTCIEKKYLDNPCHAVAINERAEGGHELTALILNKIKEAHLLQENETINVEVKDSNVTLSGTVSSKEARIKIETFVKDLKEVNDVQNNIKVSGAP